MKKICFFIRSPLDYYVISDIYKHVKDISDIVLKDLWQAHCWHPYISEALEYNKKIITDNGDDFVLHPLSERYDGRDFMNDNYSVFFYAGQPPENCEMETVRILYSLSKEKATCGNWNEIFDHILVPGEYSHGVFKNMAKTQLVGLPKFDKMFSNSLDKGYTEELRSRFNLDPNKKTILYLPTWGPMSTSYIYHEQINKLSEEYNVIIKMHDILYWCEKQDWQGKFKNSIPIINGNYDIQYLYQICDIIVGDYSGANYEALLSEKPMVLLTRDINFDVCSSTPESIDQRLRDYAPNVQLSDKDELLSVIPSLLKNDTYKEKRQAVAKELFSYNDGKCGVRAANALRTIWENSQK